ncbi:hypothetical protein AOL_s00097g95 [Orbilia oligospora ATCC 24927]|uniref:Nephrocystin 3-like N-terminal domain-containing protein n=1 Tax=Arthrobotrys oligospora (strain ATCC 24927 / CBS 115.81 / DSM 1491) TaxID=756982 RepID=G1XIB8_ARTOA|nr:hypothetical protein AOL_s00097g95 [Orbilia oligospora ATCC 24927]EGX47049.1 hypothetical protein AOL_s00097g95 [Orbilia oligospora ATCC 24927]
MASNPGIQDVTFDTSICWKLGRDKFEENIRKSEKIPEDQQKDQTRGLAAEKYGGEERQNKIGNILETLNTFKEAVDGILSRAPESVSAVWLGLGMIIKIVYDDLITCKIIVDAFDSIVTITLFTLLVEKRYLHDVSQGTGDKSMKQMAFKKLQELACAIFDFSWHTQYHLSPQWDKGYSQAQGFSEKVKSSAVKTGQKIKSAAKTVGAKFREAIIGDIKSKHEEIQGLYEEIQTLVSSLFQEATIIHNEDSIKEGNEMLRNAIETSTERLEEKIKEGNEMVVETVEATMQHSTKVIIEGVTAALETPDDILTRYIEVFQPSSALENFLLGLNNKKMQGLHKAEDVFCINGRKGHGKTMTMLSAYESLLRCHTGDEKVLVVRFFFKLGDNELQSGVRAFESLILQVIKIIKERGSSRVPALLNKILDGKNEFDIRDYKTGSGKRKCAMIRYYITAISKIFKVQIYFLLDALDECHDRGEIRLLKNLENLVLAPTPTIKVLVSVREEIGIKNELERSGVERFCILNLMPQDSSNEMELFLRKKLEEIILTRIKDRSNEDATRAEATKYMPKLQKKVEGDFAYANMVVASLQEPSRMSLEARIKNLPSSVDEIYRRSLEGMKPSQRHLIIFALQWIAWSFSDITALEIAEHYRGVLQGF